jgi:ferredoxin
VFRARPTNATPTAGLVLAVLTTLNPAPTVARQEERSMRVVAELAKCQGHGLCRMSAPDVYGVTVEEGQVIVKFDGEIPADLEDGAALGVDSCPELALSIEE